MTSTDKEKWCLSLSAGSFLFFVLYVYEGFGIPAGISPTGHGLLFRSASFGLLAFGSFSLNEFLLRPHISIRTQLHRFLWYIWQLVVIWNLTYLLINFFWDWGSYSWFAYADLLGELSAVMIIPFGLTEIYRMLSNNHQANDRKLLFESENEKERLVVSNEDFLYASSSENYVELYYTMNGSLKHQLQRNTLKSIEEQFSESRSVTRCHRSYIINPQRIIHLSESSRGGQVTLPHEITLPVSKKYLDQIKGIVNAAH